MALFNGLAVSETAGESMENREAKLPTAAKWLIGLVCVLFVLPICSGILGLATSPRAGSARLAEWEGRPVPDLTVTTTDGGTLRLSELRGRAVILDFWATWCGPCRKEIPHLQRLAQEYADDLVVIGISSEDSATLQRFVRDHSPGYAIGTAESVPSPFSDVFALPTTFFIGRDGTVGRVVVGYHDYPALRELTSQCLSQGLAAENRSR